VNPYSAYGYNPGSVLGLQAPGSQLTPEQLAELQRIRGLGGQQQTFGGNLNLEGVTPAAPGFRQQAKQVLQQGVDATGEAVGRGKEAAKRFLEKYPNAGAYARGGLALAAALPAVGTAMEELQAGRSLGAVAALAPAGLSAVGAGLIGKGPIGTVAGLGLMGLGAILPGASASAAESTRQKLTGEPTKGKEGEFSTQMAMNKQLAELGTTQYRDNMGVYTSSLKDLSKAYSDQEYLNLQRNLPLINQMKNADLVRQQALMNTQNQGYMQQGVLATAGSLALGAQQNVAQLTNTALQTNPYAGSTIQAPQIRFG
jgi:hypothetical protein